MNAEEIEAEFGSRASKWSRHPGLTKLLPLAVKRHNVVNSYDFDVLLTSFMAHHTLPDIDSVGADFEQAAEDLAVESGYTVTPSSTDVMNKMVHKYFGNVEGAAKTVIAQLFGELDGDADVDEYVRSRVEECYRVHQAIYKLLAAKKGDQS